MIMTFVVTPFIVLRLVPVFVAPNNIIYRVMLVLLQQVLWLAIAWWHLVRNLQLSLKEFGSLWAALQRLPHLVVAAGNLFFRNVTGSLVAYMFAALVLGVDKAVSIYRREGNLLPGLFFGQSPLIVLSLFLSVAVIGPVTEELLFRGYTYGMLKERMGRHAIWVSSLLFTIPHLYIIHSLPIFLMGLKLAKIYEQDGNLWDSIIAHGLYNGVMALLLIYILEVNHV